MGRHQVFCEKTRYAEKPLGDEPGGQTSFLMNIDQMRQRTIGVHYTSCTHSPTGPGGLNSPAEFAVKAPPTGLYAGQYFEASPLAPNSPFGFYSE